MGTTTPNIGLYKPAYNEAGSSWWTQINGNADIIDKYLSGFVYEVYPEWFGAVGDGVTDDTAAINAALASLGLSTASTKSTSGMQLFYADAIMTGRKLSFRPSRKYLISSPLLVESNFASSPYSYFDNIEINGNGAMLIASGGFSGVSRYYDTTHTETLTAMLIMGTRDYGKNLASHFQEHNAVRNLKFIGNGSSSLAAIRPEGSDFLFENILCQNMGYGIKTRLLKNSFIEKLKGIDVPSLLYSYNDTPAIKSGDGSSHWATGGEEGGNLHIDMFYSIIDPAKLTEANKNNGVLHLWNTGEIQGSNITILGGNRGLVVDGTDMNSVSGNKWSRWNNIEIAQTELTPFYIHNQWQHLFDKVQLTWNYQKVRNWGSGVYTDPIVKLDTVQESTFSNFIVERTTQAALEPILGGHDLGLSSVSFCTFSTWKVTGRPGQNDNVSDHVNFVNSSYNNFKDFRAINIDNASYSWRYGFNFDASSDFNDINGAWIRLVKSQGTELNFAASGHNSVRNLFFDRPSNVYYTSITSPGTTPSVDIGDMFVISASSPVTINGFARAHEGKTIDVVWSSNGNNITIAAGATFVPKTTGNITSNKAVKFRCIGQYWYEL